MCGIAGQLHLAGGAADPELVRRMSDLLKHRGPDGDGIYVDGMVALAHRRLAIIDLSEEGHQPMTNEDGTLWLVFNGEIYNYRELMEELIAHGHQFRSRTDSEVILHAYEEWGTGCLQRFNGMWAFALWDGRRRELFCARDRLGIKPFYYARTGDSFLFASEIKALRVHPEVGRHPNEKMVSAFLAWGLADHTDQTMFDGVLQLLPAHYMIVGENGIVEHAAFWEVTVNPALESEPDSDEHLSRAFLSLLEDAVDLHLRSDVPVGTCLSGGLDSSTLTVLINRVLRRGSPGGEPPRQNTFSACFEDKRCDESTYIDIVVESTGVRSHRVYPAADAIWVDIERLLYINDEPFAALTLYSQYCVMRLARDEVKVVLDGQGADELLAGYIAYQYCHIRELVRGFHILRAARETLGTLRHHSDFLSYTLTQLFARKKHRNLIRMEGSRTPRYRGTLSEVLETDLMRANLPYLLHWEDRTSMAFSIEARVPFLDYRVVEFLASLPVDQKIRGGVTKFVLRKAIRGLVPEVIRCRMDKKGFATPEEVWMQGDMSEKVLEILSSEAFKSRPYWDADAVAESYKAFLQGNMPYSSEIWRIVCCELWLRRFIDPAA
ncbi:asparagine synthase (glutamine-hydrolyzing) [Methanoculleus receptaculi]|uniref:Putative asparagine synthetase [glutamine-hydrolyzing] n=1 Tax=Methanoculleus receptaculi TaxID=394967 RepID=A0AAX4FWV3_9EURY|nr:asparagine synthase (glutamine-hydrolyzing) [Methanoculleus receptaculi]WOX58349.1 asparagine synthase (glutamine-hydrolyzing) [Methanoculleus receptaculi]